TKPFEADFTVRPLEYRAAETGPVLAGLEEIRGEGVHVDPATGAITVRSLEITKPVGNVWRDTAGIHALGLVVKIPAPESTTQPSLAQPSLAQSPPSVGGPASAGLSSPPTPTATKPPEFRIDKLIVTGIDFKLEDRTTDPTLLVPLN